MTAAELIDVMRAARKLGVVRLDVRDGGAVVEFGAQPSRPKAQKTAEAPAEQFELRDVIERNPKLSTEQLEQLRDAVLEAYVP